jgi:arsenate reductase
VDAPHAHQINMSLIVYGIPACSTVKKARTFLDEQGKAYTFHDYKKLGVPAQQLDAWIQAVGWEPLLNRQGTTWRQFDDATKATVVDAASAKALMLAKASVIKRPVIEFKGKVLSVGFDDKKAQAVLDALA